MANESAFLKSFMEKVAANPTGWLRPLNRLGAVNRLNQMKAQKAGTWGKIVQKANSPTMKARKALGFGAVGLTGAAYAGHQLTKDQDMQRVPQADYGVGIRR